MPPGGCLKPGIVAGAAMLFAAVSADSLATDHSAMMRLTRTRVDNGQHCLSAMLMIDDGRLLLAPE